MLEDRRPLVSTDPGLLACYQCHGTYSKASPSCPHCSASHVGESGIGPGSVIDSKYEILSLLGVGGMGEVFKARHVRLETFRTIKVMRKSFIADETFRGRFLREARLATQVHHPNVALVHDFATLEDGTYYMVSEFISGVTIRQWLNRSGRFGLPIAADVALQVLAGLDAIHLQGMLHRDISAENIMISTTADDRLLAKIIDLGIAKTLAAPSTEMTSAGMFIGNPRYSSPEQLGDLPAGQRLDGRADLYCLAVVLYEMVAGVSPFGSDNTRGYMIKHLTQPPTPFAETLPDKVPQKFEDVIFKALEKKRTSRWATAKDFAYALRPFMNALDGDTSSMRRSDLLQPDRASVEVTEVGRRSFSDARIYDKEDWENACSENTLEAYRGYLRKHEGGRFGTDAVKKIQEISLLGEIRRREEDDDVLELELLADSFDADSTLRNAVVSAIERVRERTTKKARELELAAWSAAESRDVVSAYEEYLGSYPSGEWAEPAKDRIRQLHLFQQIPRLESRLDLHALDAIARSETGSSELAAAIASARTRVQQALETKKREADDRDWNQALNEDSMDSFGSYLSSQPEGRYRDEARNHLRDLTAIREIIELEKANILEPLREISQTDASRRVRDAAAAAAARLDKKQIAERAHEENQLWTDARQSGTTAAWALYLERFPDSPRHSEAQQSHHEAAAFETAVATGTSVAVEEFLRDFQNGVHRAEAASLRDARRTAETERAYRKATAEGSSIAYRAFLETYPSSNRAGEVRELIEESDSFERALADPLPKHWNNHLERWKSGRLAVRAREELQTSERLRDEELSTTLGGGGSAAIQTYLQKYPEERSNQKVSDALQARKQQAEHVREENQLWGEAARAGTALTWQNYIQRFSDSPRARDAQSAHREALAFESAVSAGTSLAVRSFLRDFRSGRHVAEAESLLARRTVEECKHAWSQAISAGTGSAYRSFLETYPASSYSDEVRLLLEESESFERAQADPRVSRWQEHLRRWNSGRLAGKARQELGATEQLRDNVLKAALEDGSSSALESFIKKYPEEKANQKISAALEEAIAFDESIGGSHASLRVFLERYPDSRRAAEIKARLNEEEDTEFSAAAKIGTIRAYRDFAESYPDSRHTSESCERAAQLAAEESAIPTIAMPLDGTATVADAEILSDGDQAPIPQQDPDDPSLLPTALQEMQELPYVSKRDDKTQAVVLESARLDGAEPPPTLSEKRTATETLSPSRRAKKSARGNKSQPMADDAALAPQIPEERASDFRSVLSQPLSSYGTTAFPVPEEPDASEGRKWMPWLATAAVLLLISLGAVFLSTREQSTPPAPPLPNGRLLVEARPWAQVISVMDSSGKNWIAAATWTPVLLSLPVGDYRVALENPGAATRNAELTVRVEENGTASVIGELDTIGANDYFEAVGW